MTRPVSRWASRKEIGIYSVHNEINVSTTAVKLQCIDRSLALVAMDVRFYTSSHSVCDEGCQLVLADDMETLEYIVTHKETVVVEICLLCLAIFLFLLA